MPGSVGTHAQQRKLWKCHVEHYFETKWLPVHVFMCMKGQPGQKRRKVGQTYLPDWEQKLTVNANILLLVCAVLSPNGTDSNNCEHLGSLQALHPSPWGSSPGTGGPVQLPFLHKGCPEQTDYHSSPQGDKRTGNLSTCFTLIIRMDWQCGENTDTYHKHTTTASKSQLF